MSTINWYPGHMTKSIRMIEENIKLIDVLVYVLDARAPASCMNPDFARYIERLPVVFVLNKCDLADENETRKWLKKLSGERFEAIALDSTVSRSTGALLSAIKKLGGAKLERLAAKGVRATVRAMVLGVPNTGKSTLINNLIGKGKAITGNKAGVTRGKQWFKVNEFIEILDTPGTLYPKLSDQTTARRLAFLGSIKDEVVDVHELAMSLLIELPSELIAARYAFEPTDDGEKNLELVAANRGYVLKGGILDPERAAVAVIDDFRKGRLGKITLDGSDV